MQQSEWTIGRIQYWHDPSQQGQVEQELATKMLQIQSKRFYLDVKQNRRGRFIKVAEIGADGRRSQIFLALSTAAEFRDHLSAFSDFYSSLGKTEPNLNITPKRVNVSANDDISGPPNPDNVPEDGKLKSEMMVKDNRRYYLDLKENSRGVSCTITRGGPRSQVAIPAQGMIEFRDALTDLLDEFSTDEHAYKRICRKAGICMSIIRISIFDIGQPSRYLRKAGNDSRDILSDYCDKIKQPTQGSSGGGGISSQDQPHPLVGNNTHQDTGTSLKFRVQAIVEQRGFRFRQRPETRTVAVIKCMCLAKNA
ncbi:hypothetical protein NQ317_004665 [Molorchus minor]|uniref:Transcriptional activator protein Pur-beta n=1 Tax=Molorchus minor TaxID=1323400 RepID=A0ABQ9J3S4_9CUCU|nr:hypothetical protein NQ317_004665 [Molorchus minor]